MPSVKRRVVVACFALLPLACKDASTPEESDAATAAAADGGTASDAAGGSPGSPDAGHVDFCTILTKPLATQILGAPVKDAEPRQGSLSSCQYFRDAAGGLEATLNVTGEVTYYANSADGRKVFDTLWGHQDAEAPVAGVGDVYYVIVGSISGYPSVSLHAYQGHYFLAMDSVGATAAALEDGAKAVLLALPQ